MVRRAGKAAAVLALAAAVLPCTLLASQEAAAASATSASATSASATSASKTSQPFSVAITSMSKRWATPGSTLTVGGTLTNSSGKQISKPTVRLLSSRVPISGMSSLQQYSAGSVNFYLFAEPGATWTAAAPLAPGSTVPWSMTLRVNKIGMTTFGVYPLVAQALTAEGILTSSYSYLPYEPGKHGPDAASRVIGRKIAWAWPLIDKPILGAPWQSVCRGSQSKALVASLSPGGRLDNLLSVGKIQAGASLASRARVTWAVDPALLANAKALAACTRTYSAGARVAAAWLADLQKATKSQPMFVTPYADIDVAALAQRSQDVTKAFSLGRAVASSVLDSRAGKHRAGGQPASGLAWPAGGIGGYGSADSTDAVYGTLENLASNGISTVISEGSSALASSTVVQVPDGNGDMTVLLADKTLSQLFASAASGTGATTGTSPASRPGMAFATTQLFLAETAELAAANPTAPIIVAPPRRWQLSASLAASLLSQTKAAPWLAPVSLSAAAAAKHVPRVQPSTVRTPQVTFTKARLNEFGHVDTQIRYVQGFQEYPNNNLWLAAASLESSAWNSQPGSGAAPSREEATEYRTVQRYVTRQGAAGVQILADGRVTLGGLKGTVPVSIYNKLAYGIKVRLQVTGLHVIQDPGPGVSCVLAKHVCWVTVSAHGQQHVPLHVTAKQVGTSVVTLTLLSSTGRKLLGVHSVTMTVQATQFGVLAMIILAVALGLFLVASAARAVHRGRVTVDDGEAGLAPARAPDARLDSDEADNVSGERTELGAAGKSGL